LCAVWLFYYLQRCLKIYKFIFKKICSRKIQFNFVQIYTFHRQSTQGTDSLLCKSQECLLHISFHKILFHISKEFHLRNNQKLCFKLRAIKTLKILYTYVLCSLLVLLSLLDKHQYFYIQQHKIECRLDPYHQALLHLCIPGMDVNWLWFSEANLMFSLLKLNWKFTKLRMLVGLVKVKDTLEGVLSKITKNLLSTSFLP